MIIFCTISSGVGGVARVQQHIRNYLINNQLPYKEVSYNPDAFRLLNKVRFLSDLKRKIENSDVVIFSHPHLFKAMDKISPDGLKTIVFTHGLEMYNAGPEKMHHLLKTANCVLANSHYNYKWLKSESLLQNVHHAYYPGLTFDLKTTPTEKIVLCVGRMMKSESYKGHKELINSWKQVIEKVPDAQLVFCGTGDQILELKNQSDKMGLSDSVTFTGYVSDLELIDWYRRARAFAMPSTGEGQGLVWLEAMQVGLPVIATAGTVAEEFIDDSINGILLQKDFSTEDLSAALIKSLTDSNWRKSVNQRNKEKVNHLDILQSFNSKLEEVILRRAE